MTETNVLLRSIPDACAQLGIRRTTLYGLVKAGQLRSVRIGARALIPDSELQSYVQRLLADSGSHHADAA